jgi:hypothetical protein
MNKEVKANIFDIKESVTVKSGYLTLIFPILFSYSPFAKKFKKVKKISLF